MMSNKAWEELEHKVYYNTVTEELCTAYEIYCDFEQFKDDESLQEFNGDFLEWFNTMEIFDDFRPIPACTVLWANNEEGVQVPLFIDGYASEKDAFAEADAWGWFYDDSFTDGPLPMSVINLDECMEAARDWITDPANVYSALSWESLLYGDVPCDVLTIK